MSSQQAVNCDTYSVEANKITIQSTRDRLELEHVTLRDVEIEGHLTLESLDVTNETVLNGDLNCNGYAVFNENVYCWGPLLSLPSRGEDRFAIDDGRPAIDLNDIPVTGAFVRDDLLLVKIFRLNSFVFFDIRMAGDSAVGFDATADNITTGSIFPPDYRVQFIGVNNTTTLTCTALIGGVLVMLQAKVMSDGSLVITRPGGEFTAGEAGFYLCEMSGSFMTND